jgi:hypothetical protein
MTRNLAVRFSLAATTIACGALVVAPHAYAEPAQSEDEIKANCKDAGGTYHHDVSMNGTSFTECCYKDAEGKQGCDAYVNGVYIGTSAEKVGPPSTSGSAVPPPAKNAPIGTAPPEAR